jgi:hypothetical protein
MVTQAPVVARPKAPPETPAEGPHLSDEQLNEAMALIGASDSVELKVTVPVEDHRATIAGLPIDPVEAQLRQVWFFDTPDLALNRAGVVVRARRRTGGRGDTVIKLRPVVPDELPRGIRRSASFNVEVDILPGGFVCSGSLKGVCKGNEVSDAVAGKIALPAIYSKEQRAFYATYAPKGIDFDSLVPLGPTFVLKEKYPADIAPPPAKPRQMAVEMWLYPDGSRILELSTRCYPNEVYEVGLETRAYLVRHGVKLGGLQQTKTKAALEFFQAQLQAQSRALSTPA